MIQLPLRHHGEVLIGDDATTGRPRIVGGPPRIALDPEGLPRLRLLRWPPTADGDAGHLAVDLTTTPAPEGLAGLPDGTDFVEWEDATVTLQGAGIDVTGEAVLGGAPFGALSSMLDLPAAGALERLLTGDGPGLLQAVWNGHIRARMPAVEVVAALDRSEITRRTEDIRGPARRETVRSIIRATAHINILGAGDDDLIEALSKWVADELTRRLDAGRDLQVRLSAADVISLPVRLSGTLGAVDPSNRDRVIRRLDAVPGTTAAAHTRVVVLADWAVTDHVTLEVDPDGSGAEDTTVLTVRDEAPRQLDLANRAFRWRLRSTVEGVQQDWTAWTPAAPTLSLTVPVAPPSAPPVEVVAVGLDWSARWSRVEIFLTPAGAGEDPVGAEPQPGTVSTTGPDLVLTADRRRMTLPSTIDAAAMLASTVFWARSGTTVRGHPIPLTSHQFVIRDPLRDVMEKTLVPVGGGWDDVALAMVDLRHVDGDQLTFETVPLDPGMPLAAWRIPVAAGQPGEVSWRLHASLTDGQLLQTDWATAAESVIPVDIPGGAFVDVHVVITGLAAAAAQRVTVTVTAGSTQEVVEATEPGVHTVRLPVGTVTFASTWRGLDGTSTAGPTGTTDSDTIVVTSPRT